MTRFEELVGKKLKFEQMRALGCADYTHVSKDEHFTL